MAHFDIVMPKMGESVEEATITKWFVKQGDKVVEDDVLLEIATDKVDSEIPSPVEGVIKKILFQQDETVAVGTVIAVIDMDGEESDQTEPETPEVEEKTLKKVETPKTESEGRDLPSKSDSGKFYSPLVKKIAKEESISLQELDSLSGSGANGRVQKQDILKYLESRSGSSASVSLVNQTKKPAAAPEVEVAVKAAEGDEVIPMSRIRKIIAAHMIHSKQTSAHVTNMLEIDVTNVVNWRNRVKDEFLKKEGQKLTYLPLFLEATVKAIRDYPMINSSVDGENIIIRKNINLGIAVSLEDNNLIVPNIKNADKLNLTGITNDLNNLASAARSNKLSPDDISGGTFTVTNFGSFKNDIGTPIINQPEVAILAIGAIKKKPAVLETPDGDVIAIRQKMWIALTYDHRIIDGALGGSFLNTLGDYIESFDTKRTI
ncbi:MAG: dihydrolipoamide acetyltransferase family protein [Bacteroidales bacterium]|jgi:2-oxoglutarate dehydrogenase E2 component (dihydrolipoamide succinyltransferase)|nr:dihydrolipoamide acetyltransferase family protein [Bacteroidales bacterium]